MVPFQEGKSFMTFEGQQFFGRSKIMEKFQTLTFQKIAHAITATDCQPMFDGGIMIVVLGQLKVRNPPDGFFTQSITACSMSFLWEQSNYSFRLTRRTVSLADRRRSPALILPSFRFETHCWFILLGARHFPTGSPSHSLNKLVGLS